jgi:hypothetical protein
MRQQIALRLRFSITNGMARRKTPSDTRIGPRSNILTASRSDIAFTSEGDLAAAGINLSRSTACAFSSADDEYHGGSRAAAKSRLPQNVGEPVQREK